MVPKDTYNFKTSELPSQIFYNKLHTASTDGNHFVKYCGGDKENSLNKYPNIKNFCSNIINYLKKRKHSWNQGTKKDMYCNLLVYWIYDQLVNNFKEYTHKPIDIYGKIVNVWNINYRSSKNRNITQCDLSSEIILYDDWDMRKKLYEYLLDFDIHIKERISEQGKCEEYYEYIQEKEQLYNHFNEPCNANDQTKCPSFYNDCKKYEPSMVLKGSECNQSVKGVEDNRDLPEIGEEDGLFVRQDSQSLPEEQEVQDSPEGGDTQKAREKIQLTRQEINENYGTSSIVSEIPEEELLYVNSSRPLKIFGKALLGIFKFSPTENLLSNKIRMIKRKISNDNEKKNKQYPQATTYLNPFIDDREVHYIGYNNL
ncbi:variable surface protein [Plasmodium gonderi]|uniref:Variable surface protein n=1 Tax=Plasmodium gonderi TaxID=77519 RepID=A0A1Y1JTH0_PLAGO|nr:variable surface protein [Plasmodium gonderi]GAW84728.1 variable surface protein [Plasmodium gonderi]